jgi:hypothetical protein
VLAKGEDYEIWLADDLKPRFALKAKVADADQPIALTSGTPLVPGRAHHLAINYELKTVQADSGEMRLPKYEVHVDLYLDGQLAASGIRDGGNDSPYRRFDDPVVP